jgi:Na+/melibiose symporter-like transporter
MGSSPDSEQRAKLRSIRRVGEMGVAVVAFVALFVALQSAPPSCSEGLVPASTQYLASAWITVGAFAIWTVLAVICRRQPLAKLGCFLIGGVLFLVIGFSLVLASSPCSFE